MSSELYEVGKEDLELALTEAVNEVSNGKGETEELEDSSSNDEPDISTITSSSTAANKSKLVITSNAPEEEMDISFTEEDQSASQLHITKEDQPNMVSSMIKDKKKRKKKKSGQNQSQKANQANQPIPSSSSSNPFVLEKSSPTSSST
ncbi:hypothetical protein RclHR1_19510002 [Rhizophagus clarus]|uniref:Uncharacterized protein n=1 Tax=Rhizophagus clarus TaxID=94130 RepID=A0A2Z6QPM1_9GLOM|nr:hypothetical protein RclHR1_19510002 [Rhizophagus clarus]